MRLNLELKLDFPFTLDIHFLLSYAATNYIRLVYAPFTIVVTPALVSAGVSKY